MPSYLTSVVLQWSADPLSDTTPTWTTIDNNEIRSIEWWAGIDREGNDPEPGGMQVTLKNKLRKWEPLFGSNTIDTQQRFRLTVNGTQEGVWYSESFDLDYPDGQDFSWVTIGCGDGQSILALDDLTVLDPPEAEAYEDVVNFDAPWGYWRMGEVEGTQASANIKKRFRGKGKNRRKIKVRRGTRYSTREEAAGSAGPSGVYRNTPALGFTGAILGDPDTSVEFRSAQSEFMRVPVEQDTFIDRGKVSVECWVNPTADASMYFIGGPFDTPSAQAVFALTRTPSDVAAFLVLTSVGAGVTVSSTTTLTPGEWYHLVGTYDGGTVRIYVNGVEEDFDSAPGAIPQADASQYVYVGQSGNSSGYADAAIDEVAVYEYALSAERIAAHYDAGSARGSAQEDAADRVSTMALSSLWSVVTQTPNPEVLPIMWHGQTRTEEVAETVQAMGPQSMFWFNGDGDAVFFGYQWQTMNTAYNTVQATFTDDGTGKPYQDVAIEYDFETFNEVLASHESGESVLVTDTTESGKRGRRVHSEYTDVLLVNHHDVEGLAAGVLDYYKEPAKRPVTLTIDSYHCLNEFLALDIGYFIHVKKQGETGAATERASHIIAKRKTLERAAGGWLGHATYTLSRGFDPTDGFWHLGYDGFSELGETTVLA